ACPELVGDVVAERPDNALRPVTSVTPGMHRPEVGTHRVVWWSPAALELLVEESVGLKQQALLTADDRRERSDAGTRTHHGWQATRARGRAAGAEPWQRVVTATEHAVAVAVADAAAVTIEVVGASGPRPHGVRFGSLVHAVLAAVALDAERAAVAD